MNEKSKKRGRLCEMLSYIMSNANVSYCAGETQILKKEICNNTQRKYWKKGLDIILSIFVL